MVNELIWNSGKNELKVIGKFYNGIWFHKFAEIQHYILELRAVEIIVSLQECFFISPTPFLSLLLTLNKAKIEHRCKITIYLMDENRETNKKFLNYCAREGFIEIINQISEKEYDASEFKEYNLIGTENFEPVLNARIINVGHPENTIEDLVNLLINEINQSNLSINKNQKLYMLVALRNILQELIDNVDKHAYYGENKFFAVYVRMRYVTETTIRVGNQNNMYDRLRGTTKPEEIYVHKALEVYFQDIGKGIVKSYEEKGAKYDKRPLREIVNYVFFREEFEFRENNTPVNGLAFLRKILQEKNNYFSVYNQFEGTGAFGVRDKKININNIHMKDIDYDIRYGIEGQIYNFTLFDRNSIGDENTEGFEGLLDIYKRKYQPIDRGIIDLRESVCFFDKNVNKISLLFMPEYLTKNVIVNTINNVVNRVPGIETLIISDIKDEEFILFDFTLDGLFKDILKQNIKDEILLKKIYVVTRSLKLGSFDTSKSRLVRCNDTFLQFNQAYDYLYSLKVYESKKLADILERNTIGRYILTKGKIEWTGGQTFNGFINFDMLAANDTCFELLQTSLERIVPIIGKKKLYAIDSMVERFVSSINCFMNVKTKEQFGVGSVFISGMTLQSSDFQGNTIHFFCRGGERQPALFFDPVYLYNKVSDENSEMVFTRIGKTSRIKRKDSKENVRNTNSYLNEKETYKILHQYAYSSVLCGHLNFEKRHDLMSINLKAIMYDESTRLKEYVECVIKYSLGHYRNEKLKETGYFTPFTNTCMIVYPYNQFTTSILKQCNIRNNYSEYIIGLTPNNITSFGEDLEYSQCFTDYICEIISEYRKRYPDRKVKIIVFDTLSYSGRTRHDIYEYVNSIEEVEVYYVSIIDARVNHYTKQNNTFNYMNVNIPLLGNSETCKLCLVLNKIDTFKDNIIDASIWSAIENIQTTWAVQDVRNYNEIIKLCNFDRIYAQNIASYEVSLERAEDSLYFINALPLYIFITNRIKLENDFSALEFVLDNYCSTIGEDSMAYILSLFLLEYGDAIYHSLLRKVCYFLLAYMRKSVELELRQLVVIAILSLEEEKAAKIVFNYISEDSQNVQSNQESQIVFMYFLNKVKGYENDGKIAFLYNKMKSGNNRLDLYKQFHCQLKNTNGNIHNSPLKRFIDGNESIENTKLVLASLSLLEHSLNRTELSFDMLYEEGQDDEEKNSVSEIKEDCLKDIAAIKGAIKDKRDVKIDRKQLEKIFFAGQQLHTKLFAPYVIQANSENRDIKNIVCLLIEVIEKYNEKAVRKTDSKQYFPVCFDFSYNGTVRVSSNISAIYYIWNNMLVKEIDYLFDNVTKFVSEEMTVCTEDGKKVAGVVGVEITPEAFIINVYNNTAEDVEVVRRKAKQRYQKEVLRLLGVKFEYCRNEGKNPLFEKNAIVSRIVIPNIQNVGED